MHKFIIDKIELLHIMIIIQNILQCNDVINERIYLIQEYVEKEL